MRHRPFFNAYQGRAGNAVENVNPTGLAGLGQGLALAALEIHIEQDHRVRRIVVPDIVVHLLEMPTVFAGVSINGYDGRGEQVVAGADGAVVIRAGVAGRKVDQAEFGIQRWRLPHRATTELPGVAVLRP